MASIDDEIIDKMRRLKIDCPECDNMDDDQYQCGTCGCGGGYGQIHVIRFLEEKFNLNLSPNNR